MTDFRILDPTDGIPVPWPNGGGTSQEIVGHSEGDRLVWRMSTTHILASCPFSDYAGNARCITLLSEEGFDLDFGDTAPRLTARRFEPLPFDGGWPTTCHLQGRPAFVLNVMTLQGAARCETKVIALGPEEATWRLPTAQGMIFCADGTLHIGSATSGPRTLTTGKTLAIKDGANTAFRLRADGPDAKAIVVSVHV